MNSKRKFSFIFRNGGSILF